MKKLLLYSWMLIISIGVFAPDFVSDIQNKWFENSSEIENANNSNLDLPKFTLEQIALYDGVKSKQVYIVVNGLVYDATSEFPNGMHQGFQLGGKDVTKIFESSPHTMNILNSLKVVGIIATAESITLDPPSTPTVNDVSSETLPIFTLDTLSIYNGQNGQPVYLAVSGVVYNGTSEFPNGMHQGFQLGGKDATAIFQVSPHALSILNQLPIVGSLEGYPTIPVSSVSQTPSVSTPSDDEDDYDEDDRDDQNINNYVLDAIMNYIELNYPRNDIDEIEYEDRMYEVELKNDLELYFDASGNFLYSRYDD